MDVSPAGKCCLLFGVFLWARASVGLTTQGKGERNAHPEVMTTHGRLQGTVADVKGANQLVNAFLGIPFAKPPVGSLRFAPPQPPAPWSHVRNATISPPMCLQDLGWYGMLGNLMNTTLPNLTVSEDCLYLNVFTPDTKAQLPVMVWIHGGKLEIGGISIYDGSVLAAYENVVVVLIQYRLGLPGFFSTGSVEARGNWGLLDQRAALQWVQENIQTFGGDPRSVTIFGQSAGGLSVGAQILSPLSKGLFHRAISESGVVQLPGLLTPHPEVLAKEIANVSGCGTSSAEMVRCLRNKTEEELQSLSKETGCIYMVVDGEFFPKAPEELLAAKEFSAVPYLLGVNNHEYGWLIPGIINFPVLRDGVNRENITAAFQPVASLLGLPPQSVQEVLDEYLGDTEDPLKLRDIFQDLMGDALFVVPAIQAARSHRDSGAPVYFYEFRHRSSLFKDTKPDFVKADHGDEVFFVFGEPLLRCESAFIKNGDCVEDEKQLSRTVMKYWARFARTGNPNGEGLVEWPRYDRREGYLELDLKQRRAKDLRKEQVDFWTGILPATTKETHVDL